LSGRIAPADPKHAEALGARRLLPYSSGMESGTLSDVIVLDGQSIPLRLKWHAGARRLTMTVDHTQRCLRLVLPRGVAAEAGLAFCRRHAAWIAARWSALPEAIPFAPGVTLPIHGVEQVICHRPEARRGVWQEAERICVSGRLEYLPRRVESHCRAEAGRLFRGAVKAKTAAIGMRAGRVSLRESRSRWGSCSPKGDLSFCWRLIFAPPAVLDYVVAHEVAHLRHMNHSPQFWRLCASLVPDTAGPKRWLARNGASLWCYGSAMAMPGTQM